MPDCHEKVPKVNIPYSLCRSYLHIAQLPNSLIPNTKCQTAKYPDPVLSLTLT